MVKTGSTTKTQIMGLAGATKDTVNSADALVIGNLTTNTMTFPTTLQPIGWCFIFVFSLRSIPAAGHHCFIYTTQSNNPAASVGAVCRSDAVHIHRFNGTTAPLRLNGSFVIEIPVDPRTENPKQLTTKRR
jgi:hypothetical protein